VAKELLGTVLIRRSAAGLTSGVIVETEAYLPNGDPACHGAKKKTPKNEVMFGPPGISYVYSIHAHHCVNLVTESAGQPAAVLVRAVLPLQGLELMQKRRQRSQELELTRGPGRLCQAMQIDRRLDGWDVTKRRRLWIEKYPKKKLTLALQSIVASPRIGVTSGEDLKLRFFYENCRFVSGKRKPW